ncbi:uncharacterized protein [Euwallacea similis]|uniref:uncharacterized protein n=1 Tax=Euwallacea similis TaxID=1736056 RepID=UPI00344B2002
MNGIIGLFAMTLAMSFAMSVPIVNEKPGVLRQGELEALIRQYLRERRLYKQPRAYALNLLNRETKRCANFGDDGCASGGIPGAGADSDWIDGGFTPGKRCANFGDDGCGSGGIPGAGADSDWIDGGFTPGKRSLSQGEGRFVGITRNGQIVGEFEQRS